MNRSINYKVNFTSSETSEILPRVLSFKNLIGEQDREKLLLNVKPLNIPFVNATTEDYNVSSIRLKTTITLSEAYELLHVLKKEEDIQLFLEIQQFEQPLSCIIMANNGKLMCMFSTSDSKAIDFTTCKKIAEVILPLVDMQPAIDQFENSHQETAWEIEGENLLNRYSHDKGRLSFEFTQELTTREGSVAKTFNRLVNEFTKEFKCSDNLKLNYNGKSELNHIFNNFSLSYLWGVIGLRFSENSLEELEELLNKDEVVEFDIDLIGFGIASDMDATEHWANSFWFISNEDKTIECTINMAEALSEEIKLEIENCLDAKLIRNEAT